MGVRIPSNIWLKDGRSCLAVGLWTISHMMNFHSKSKLTKSWGTKNKANLPKRLQCSVYIQLLPLFKQALPSCKKHTKLQKPFPQRLPQENLYHIFQVPSPNPKQNNHKTTPNKHIQTNLFQPPPPESNPDLSEFLTHGFPQTLDLWNFICQTLTWWSYQAIGLGSGVSVESGTRWWLPTKGEPSYVDQLITPYAE